MPTKEWPSEADFVRQLRNVLCDDAWVMPMLDSQAEAIARVLYRLAKAEFEPEEDES